tara:strand:+ start:3274 stop:4527 length:1254 start_codon:yes stop_codon:yes gene_type:complete
MALRIRRGTEADRQLLTGQDPAVGEPIFVTDTNKLYIGKSGTTGGQIINPDQALNDLSNVNCPTPTNGQALVFNTAQNKWINGAVQTINSIGDIADVDITTAAPTVNQVLKWDGTKFIPANDIDTQIALASASIDDLGDVSTSGVDAPSNGQVLAWNAGAAQFKPINPVFNQTGTFDGTFEGTMKGTLVGDDSTILVDGITNTIKLDNGQIFFDGVQIKLLAGNNNLKFGEVTDNVGPTFQLYNTDKSQPIEIISVGGTGNDFSKFQFNVKDNSLQTPVTFTAGDSLAGISWNGWDTNNSKYIPSAQMYGKVSTSAGSVAADTVKGTLVFATNDGTASAPSLKFMEFTSDGRLSINSQTANATLDVNGNAKIGTELLLGSMTTTQRDALTAANGMIIYNTTDNKFQGYENGAWSNLI